MKNTALVLMMLTILSKLIGFGRDITLSYFYGASNISDAYLISLTIPLSIFAFIGTGIATSYIPIYNDVEKEKDIESADRFTSNSLNFILIICTIIVIISSLFTEEIVKLFASGFEGDTLKLAAHFTKISIWSIYFSSLIYIFKSYLQLKNQFIIPALIGIPLNFFTILSIVISYKSNITVLAIGSVVATFSQLALMIPSVLKRGYKYKFVIDKDSKYIKRMVYLSLPVILGVSANQINVLVDRTIASRIATGGISALNYANRLNLFVQGIVVMSISTAMYPMISRMASDNNIKGFKKSILSAINGIDLLVMPAIIGSMIFSKEIVELLFGRGEFGEEAIIMTGSALFFYSIGMIGFGLREVLSRAFYSLQDTKTPMINAAISMILNIILNLILSKYLGIGGLALATSISAIFCTLLLILSLRKKVGAFGIRGITVSFIKIFISSVIMGIVAKVAFELSHNIINKNIALILSIGLGALIYFILIYMFKLEDAQNFVNVIKNKIKSKK